MEEYLHLGSDFDLPMEQLLRSEMAGEAGGMPPTLDDFERYLTARREPERPYGMFSRDVTMCRFFDAKDGESLLAEIERKNEAEGMGNIAIPNTGIRLINYSVCPQCKKVFSFYELGLYYGRPKSDSRFSSPSEQMRNDTRVECKDCGAWFLPALVIVDGTPKTEVQFLCRNQTMGAIEQYLLLEMKKTVLTGNRENILVDPKTGLKAVRNDVTLKQLEAKPTLIVNMLQYTPAPLVINLIEGTSVEKGDVLYGHWGKPLKW